MNVPKYWWTPSEIKESLDFYKKLMPSVPVVYDSSSCSIDIGVDGEFISIEKDLMDENCKTLDETDCGYCYSEDDTFYYGEVRIGYRIVSGHCYLCISYLELLEALKAAANLYHGIIIMKMELKLPVYEISAKQFGLI